MALVVIDRGGAQVRVRGGALTVSRDGVILQTLQSHAITELHAHPATEITAAARRLLLSEGIDVVFLDGRGRLSGRLVSASARSGERRLAWYALTSSPARRLAISQKLIAGKITNQRTLFLHRQRRLQSAVIASALSSMRVLATDAEHAMDLASLRGTEGLAARLHFTAFAAAITNPAFTFTGRNRRPPRDPINAALSFGYTCLIARCEGAARRAGLDPILGCLHEPQRGAPVLAFDLAEALRPVVDGVVLTLINRRQLTLADFRHPPARELGEKAELAGEAVYLERVGVSILIRALEARFRQKAQHPIQGTAWPLGELVIEQARQLARIAEGHQDTYHPLILAAP